MTSTIESVASFDRYVPRIATNWEVDAPGRTWQELDATLCFVDISGFTNLSEKLARRGRIGAEELTAVLNLVFASMLEIAYLQGGSLLKFGGDALLLLFTGHDHATRAASAAVEMRSALRAATDSPVTAGRVRLRMSVGIHSGPIHVFRVGSMHQELVIAGVGGTTTTAMEKVADPGEILLSAGTRDRLPTDAIGKSKGAGWLLRWRKAHCIAPGPVARDARDPEILRAWIPVELREYLGAGDTEPEHRIVSVGFVRFCGVDQRLVDEGADWVAGAIDETMTLIQSIAADEEITFLGTDINEDGGKAILVAGAPIARDGDEGRLLRAVRAMADAPAPLDLHIGVNRGHVFAGEVGTEFRSTYTVMGDTVNVAARLMAAAPARSVYATPGLLDQSGTLFAAAALPPLQVKGKSEPLTAYSVGEELGDRSADARDELPFVGRIKEMADLRGLIDSVGDGKGAVATVIGDAGSGKSRLVRQALLEYPHLEAITVRAEPYGSATPYRPLRDPFRLILGIERANNNEMAIALEQKVAAVAPDLLPMLPLLADVAGVEIDDTPEVAAIELRFRQDRLADAVGAILDRVLLDPTVIEIEDAHWIDDASAHLLTRFVDNAADRPWVFIVTRRPSEGGFTPKVGMVLELAELTFAEVEEIVLEATKAAPLRPHEIEAVATRAGGNPLFVNEIVRVVRETGTIDQLPDSLGTVVSASIDALPPLTRRILRYASVLGRSFRTETVRAVLSEGDLVLDSATRLLLDDFLEPSGKGRLRFRTAMVRDVAYDGLSYRRRAELHVRAARAIEEAAAGDPEDVADQLAMHYSLGHDHEQTWNYARVAAVKAARSYANIEAQTQYERALDAAKRLPNIPEAERLAVWIDLGDVRERAGLYDGALEAYRRAFRLVRDDPVEQAELLLKRAWVWVAAGKFSTALRETTRARKAAEMLGMSANKWRARAMALAALIRQRQERPRDALEDAEGAMKAARSANDKAALARATSVTSWARLMLDLPGARELFEEAYSLYQQLGDLVGEADVAINLGGLAYFEGRWADALAYYEKSRSSAQRLGNVGDASYAEMNIGELLVNQRRVEEAESVLRRAARVLRSIGLTYGANFAEMQLGRALMARGAIDEAETVLVAVREELIDLRLAAGTYEAALYLGECLHLKGDPEGALAVIDKASMENPDEASIYSATEARVRASSLAALSQRSEALEVVERGLEAARQRGLDYDLARLLEINADLRAGDSPGMAAASRQEASALYLRLGVITDMIGESAPS